MNEDMMKLANEYAAAAQNLLEEQGEPYTEEDIAKVAEFLIENDYPSEDGDEYFDKLAEEAFMAGFDYEMEKQAMRNPNELMRAFAEFLSKKVMPKGDAYYFNKARQPKWKLGTRISNWIDDNPLKAGYGATALGAGAVGGLGYGGYRLMKD